MKINNNGISRGEKQLSIEYMIDDPSGITSAQVESKPAGAINNAGRPQLDV